MATSNVAPIFTPELQSIAARLAHEGVPVAAIARSLNRPSEAVRESLHHSLAEGILISMPRSDWPSTGKTDSRSPVESERPSDDTIMFRCQRALSLTRLEASFIVVLLKRNEADKETLHRVIETQRAIRNTRPDAPEATDPKMVDVVICKLRKKLTPKGIEIKTLWGSGYFIDKAGKAIANQFVNQVSGNG